MVEVYPESIYQRYQSTTIGALTASNHKRQRIKLYSILDPRLDPNY